MRPSSAHVHRRMAPTVEKGCCKNRNDRNEEVQVVLLRLEEVHSGRQHGRQTVIEGLLNWRLTLHLFKNWVYANGQRMHYRHSSLVALVEMLIINNCETTRRGYTTVQCREGFTRSGSPHRSLVLSSVCCIVALRLSVDYPCGRLLMVSTRQAEAANGPTHATESTAA